METPTNHESILIELKFDVDQTRPLLDRHFHHPAVGALGVVQRDDFDLSFRPKEAEDVFPRLLSLECAERPLSWHTDLPRVPPRGNRHQGANWPLGLFDSPNQSPSLLIGCKSLHPSLPII